MYVACCLNKIVLIHICRWLSFFFLLGGEMGGGGGGGGGGGHCGMGNGRSLHISMVMCF